MIEQNDTLNAILKKNNLRRTPVRTSVLNLFLDYPEVALSHHDIEDNFEEVDRVTLYRTLKTFEKKGIIHQALDGSGVMKFALCHLDCDEEKHLDNHAHFKCVNCERTLCLEDVQSDQLTVPDGYKVESAHLVIHGECKDCS